MKLQISSKTLVNLLLAAALSAGAAMAQAKSVPGDGATPVVELMPLIMKHEVDLKLSPEQIKAMEGYRKEAAPGRIALQKKIVDLRGQLRMAILDNKPAPERETLMKDIAEAEVAHFKGRERCVEFTRKTLSAEQFAQLSKLYLDGLR